MKGANVEAALAYAGAGWAVFPVWGIADDGISCGCGDHKCKAPAKHPANGMGGHDKATTDKNVLSAWWAGKPDCNLGISMIGSGLITLDVDARSGGLESLQKLKTDLGEDLPRTLTALTGGTDALGRRGYHLVYRVPAGRAAMKDAWKVYKNLGDKGYDGIDVKWDGYIVGPPSLHVSGLRYEWVQPGGPIMNAPVEAPDGLLKLIEKPAGSSAFDDESGVSTGDWQDLVPDALDVEEILAKGIAEGGRNNALYQLTCAVANQMPKLTSFTKTVVLRAMMGANKTAFHPPLDDDEARTCIEGAIRFVEDNPLSKKRGRGKDVLDLKGDAELAEFINSHTAPAGGSGGGKEITAVGGGTGATPAPGGGGSSSSGGGGLPIDGDTIPLEEGESFRARSLTDKGNARRLGDHWAGDVFHALDTDEWFMWSRRQNKWRRSTASPISYAAVVDTLITREITLPGADMVAIGEWATQSKSTAKLEACIKQWKHLPDVQAYSTEWDAKPLYLGVGNGVLDLTTGTLMAETQDMKILSRSSVDWGIWSEKSADKWMDFVRFACKGDTDFMEYLQMAVGYTLTGWNNIDAFFVLHGESGSGKSTLVESVAHILGPMATTLNRDLFGTRNTGSSLEYQMAQLQGKRFGMMSEWPADGGRIREEVIKQLTGGSLLTGRHPAGRQFDFNSIMKLWLDTNHKPAIDDDAMWRRIRVIPFVNVPSETMRSDVKEWAKGDTGDPTGPGTVLAWAVRGAMKYIALVNSGISDPLDVSRCAAVRKATVEYRGEEDRLGLFIEEVLEPANGYELKGTALWEEYGFWIEERGERSGSRTAFDKRFRERKGMDYTGSGRSAILKGWKLKPASGSWNATDEQNLKDFLNR